MKENKTRRITQYGLLVALALILSYLEAQLPVFFAVPGMKLGLTNVVVLLALYCMGAKSALAVNFVRIALVSILFGNGMSFWYSLAGGLLSLAFMFLLEKTKLFSPVGVSMAGGVMHNVGQVTVAALVVETGKIYLYLPVLSVTGLITGTILGVAAVLILKRLKRV